MNRSNGRKSILSKIPGKITTFIALIAAVGTIIGTLYTLELPPFKRTTQQEISLPVITSFTANPSILHHGDGCTLIWMVDNAKQVNIEPEIGKVAMSGSISVSPTATTVYKLTAENEAGSNFVNIQVLVEEKIPVTITLDYSEKFSEEQHISDTIEVGVGDEIEVILSSNPSTGYSWPETAQISDLSVIEQSSREWIPPELPESEELIVGTPGQVRWIFKTFDRGTSTISMAYSRPWEGGEKGVLTLVLVVIVE